MNRTVSRWLRHLALLGALAMVAATPVAARMTSVQRYPREGNPDGSFKCYPDGCPLLGLCCS